MAYRQDLVGDQWRYDKDYHRLADLLEINKFDRDNHEVAQKLALLWDWAMITRTGKSIEDALWSIYNLKRRLGISYQGKPLANELYQYIRLEMDTKFNQVTEKMEEKSKLEKPKLENTEKPIEKKAEEGDGFNPINEGIEEIQKKL